MGGFGVEQDKKTAIDLYFKALDMGNDTAEANIKAHIEQNNDDTETMNRLADYYNKKQDYANAIEMYKKAADNGNANAMCSLGHIRRP